MRLPFSFLPVWRPTNYLHGRLSSLPRTRTDLCSLHRYKVLPLAVPPQKPTVHDEKGRRLLSKLGPYKVGDEAVVTCKTTGGESNWVMRTQRSAKVDAPGCVNAAGKLSQK